MSPAIVRGDDLDVLALPAAVGLLILDAEIGEVDLVVEVRQVVIGGPLANFIRRAIRVAVVVATVAVVLVEATLILALEFVVEDDAIDTRTALVEPRRRLLVRAIDLDLVLPLAFTHEACVELLRPMSIDGSIEVSISVTVKVAVAFQRVPARLGQSHRVVAVSRDAGGLDQALLAEVPQVAGTCVPWPAARVFDVAAGDYAEGSDGPERARLRAAQGVFAVAVANDLAVRAARQTDMAGEHTARVRSSLPAVFIAATLSPWNIVSSVLARCVLAGRLAVAARAAAERPCISCAVVSVARAAVIAPPGAVVVPRGGVVATASVAATIGGPAIAVMVASARTPATINIVACTSVASASMIAGVVIVTWIEVQGTPPSVPAATVTRPLTSPNRGDNMVPLMIVWPSRTVLGAVENKNKNGPAREELVMPGSPWTD